MKNYKLIIQYDGTNYCGWQIQKNAPSVQKVISDAVEVLLRESVNLIGSGRTDTGVHALGQTANFKTEEELDPVKFQYSLNSILPHDISIIEIKKTYESFNARFSAKKRSYIYLFSKIKSPFYDRYSYRFPPINTIDLPQINKLSKILLGEYDFTSFSRKNSKIKNKSCSIYNIHWRSTNQLVIFYIEADRFLHGMVRTILGTLLETAKHDFNEDYLTKILNKKERTEAGEAVPAKGLFLYKVRY